MLFSAIALVIPGNVKVMVPPAGIVLLLKFIWVTFALPSAPAGPGSPFLQDEKNIVLVNNTMDSILIESFFMIVDLVFCLLWFRFSAYPGSGKEQNKDGEMAKRFQSLKD